MDIWVNSRTRTEDYTWRTCAGCGAAVPPAYISDGYDQWKFEDCVPWFGLVSRDGTSTLFFGNLPTEREDSRSRPIFVHAALHATDDADRCELLAIVSSLLVQEKDLLSRWTEYLLSVFDGGEALPRPACPEFPAEASPAESIGRFVFPREDLAARKSVSEGLRNVGLECPLAVGVTGRSGKGIFERVCNSDAKWQAAFFSGMSTVQSELEPKKVEPRTDFPLAPAPRLRMKRRLAVMGLIGVSAVLLGICLVRGCRKSPGESVASPKQSAPSSMEQAAPSQPQK